MATTHPVHGLCAALEAQRLQAVETLQAALTAVREEIEAHSIGLGWGEDPQTA